MKLLSEDDLYNKKIIIVNNLSIKKISHQVSYKLKRLNPNYLVIFLSEISNKELLKNNNYRIFSWSIFKNSVKKRFDSHWSAKLYLNKNHILKKKKNFIYFK